MYFPFCGVHSFCVVYTQNVFRPEPGMYIYGNLTRGKRHSVTLLYNIR